jgi:hypothetical protein
MIADAPDIVDESGALENGRRFPGISGISDGRVDAGQNVRTMEQAVILGRHGRVTWAYLK